jgi:hypothetical protein
MHKWKINKIKWKTGIPYYQNNSMCYTELEWCKRSSAKWVISGVDILLEVWPFSFYCRCYFERCNKIESKKCHTDGTIPKSNIKIIERGKIDTPNTQIHDRSLSWLGTPNTQIHDRSLSWLGTPNTQIHDRSLSWLVTGTSI